MKVVKSSLLIAIALMLTGCVLSREPFYTQEVTIKPLKIDGNWHLIGKDGEEQENEFWKFEGNKATAFDERGQWRSFTLTWFKVGGTMFVDSIPDEPGDDITASEAYRSVHLVPFHMLSKVERAGGKLILRPLLTKEFKPATADKAIASWVEQTDYETWVFNAPSADWVAFLGKHAKDEGLFSEESKLVFVRQTD